MLIYVVDDHDMMREAAVILIRRLAKHASVWDFPDLDKFIMAVKIQGMPDLVVLDLKLPGIVKYEGVEKVRKACPDSKLAVYSATPAIECEHQCIHAGADVHIAKSNSAGSFVTALQDLLK